MKHDPRMTYVDIATRRFAQHGLHGVSLSMLAKDAGVSKQALLHFFHTKERLYREVLATLCDRLCAEIDATSAPDPVDHLTAYYTHIANAMLSDPQDVRLVIRALLDSDPNAKLWPLKPYLDRLTDLVRSLPNGANTTRERALAETYRFIGSIQYVAISLPTVQGIYGETAHKALARNLADTVDHEISRLCQNIRSG